MRSIYRRLHQRWSISDALRRGLVEFDEGVTFSPGFQLKLQGDGRAQVQVGKHSHLDGRMVIRGNGRIRIGAYCSFRLDSYLGAVSGIDIGDNVFGAEGIFVIDNNNHPVDPDARRAMTLTPIGGPLWHWTAEGVESAPVAIGDNVWLGRNAVVLKGVRIGEGSIVALGAIVTRNVPPLSIVAGNPARVVRTIAGRGQSAGVSPE